MLGRRNPRGDGTVDKTHAHPLERAGEHELVDRAVREEVRAQIVASRGELDLLGPQHRDDLVLAAAVELVGRRALFTGVAPKRMPSAVCACE